MKKMVRDAGVLFRKYVMPPFSVLDTRSGEWQGRKQQWLALSIQEETGRTENLLAHNQTMNALNSVYHTGASYFDPVLTECLIEWFCPRQGHILDPFAGGSVRGIVATLLDRSYTGIELRPEQVAANEAQRVKVLALSPDLRWLCADSNVALDVLRDDAGADMILTCPPYGDLEVYGNDPADLSVIAKHDHAAFVAKYRSIIAKAAQLLRQDRFAAFVVGDYRDKQGFYRDFVSTTIAACEATGLRYYNEAILVQPIGTLAMRSSGFMTASRKLGRCHQNVLIFVKGDPKAATQACLKDAPAELGYKGLPIVSKPKRSNARRDVSVGVPAELKGEAPVRDGGVGVEDRGAVVAEARELGGEGDGGGPVPGSHEASELG